MLSSSIFVFRSPSNVLFLQAYATFDWLFYKEMSGPILESKGMRAIFQKKKAEKG